MSDLNGFTTFRTRPAAVLERPRRERRACAQCGHALAELNGEELCFACQDKRDDEQLAKWNARRKLSDSEKRMIRHLRDQGVDPHELARRYAVDVRSVYRVAVEEPAGRMSTPRRRKRKEEQMAVKVGDVSLIPEAPPGRVVGRNSWRDVVDGFLNTGEESVRVDAPSKAKSVYASLTAALRAVPELRSQCFATVRQGNCYLVRVPR